jgi:DNA-directed RNA polymerase specialized sigma24 family protein
VADEALGAVGPDDATLLNEVRAGNTAAYGLLYQRHGEAARRLARDLVVSPVEVEEILAETFDRVLAVLRSGGGPAEAFRQYVLTALRRVCGQRLQNQRAWLPQQDQKMPHAGTALLDPAAAEPDSALIVRAFMSLPERWSALLWHSEIEQEGPEEYAPIFALSLDLLAAMERRAREELREAYLQLHLAQGTRPECQHVTERLGGFLRYSLSAHETVEVAEHLSECDDCRRAYSELADLGATLRTVVAPVYLGDAAASYLSDADYRIAVDARVEAAGTKAVELYRASGGEVAVLGPSGTAQLAVRGEPMALSRRRPARRRRIVLAAVCALALVSGGAAIASTLLGHKNSAPPHTAFSPTVNGVPATPAVAGQAPGKKSKSRHHGSASPRTRTSAPAPVHSTGPAPSPTQSAGPTSSPTPGLELAASVNINSFGNSAQVGFVVNDTGNSASGTVTATISLPSGAALGGNAITFVAQANDRHNHGWNCQPTSTGASCQHDPISAGNGAQGSILVQLSGSAACGQAVELTVTSDSASVSAQSPDVFQCGEGGNGFESGAAPRSDHLPTASPGSFAQRDMTCLAASSEVGCRYIVMLSREVARHSWWPQQRGQPATTSERAFSG